MDDIELKTKTVTSERNSNSAGKRQRSKPEVESENILISLVLNFSISIIEVIGGIFSGSISLLADALHIFGDTLSALLKYFALKKKSSRSKEITNSNAKKNEIVASLLNALVLISIAVFIAIEAYKRYVAQEQIHHLIVIVVSGMALGANLISLLLFGQEKKKNKKVKSAFKNQFLDSISTLLVLCGAIIMHYYRMYWIDTVVAIIIVILILKTAFTLINNTVDNFLSTSASQIDEGTIKNIILRQEGIVDVHHIHIWNLNEYDMHFDCHIVLSRNMQVAEAYELRRTLKKTLLEHFKFKNFTFQFEFKSQQY